MEGDERVVVPGHFMLQIPINKLVNIDRNVVIAKLTELQNDLKTRLDRPEELAIRNLLGVMSFRIREYENALDHFNAVLLKDPVNLNSLANLQYVMEKLFRMTDAQFYKDKHENLLHLGDVSSTDESKQPCRRLKARCIAEQAYAYACDIHIDRVGEIRYIQANYLYEDAFKLAGDLVEPSEKDNWKFCMAKNAHKIFNCFTYKAEFADAVDHLALAEKLFYEVTQSIPGDPEFQWESWRNLADLIRGTIHKKEFKSYAFRPELKEYQENPEKCMIKATEIAPENAKLWARYANFVHSLKKKDCTKRAMNMLQQSLTLDRSENNYYAFSTRARINLNNYKYWLTESEKDQSKTPPHPRQLEEAKTDFEIALTMTVTPWDLSYLGEVHHLLAKHPEYKEKGSKVVRQLLEKALLYFTKAADCEDGESRREVHLMRGRCLNDMGEYLAAVGCFKQAILCEPEVSQYSGDFNELLQVYLHLLQIEAKPLKDESLLAEIAYDLKTAQIKYGKSNLQKHSISKMKSKYKAEIQMLADYCKRFQEHYELVHLLSSVMKEPPFACPVRTGGTLEESWKAPFQSQKAQYQPHKKKGPIESHQVTLPLSSDQHTGIEQHRKERKLQPHRESMPSYGPHNAVKDDSHSLAGQAMTRQDGTVPTAATGQIERSKDDGKEARNIQDVTSLAVQFGCLQSTESEGHVDQIRKAPELARVSGFKYDFYVVYPDGEKDWVLYTLLRELEYMWRLKGCARHRDALPGTFKVTEEINQMKDSASILLVIGYNFHKCEQAMHQALILKREEGYERVIIPVLVNEESMPQELERFNPFDATGDVKWNKLAICIEQQIKPVSF